MLPYPSYLRVYEPLHALSSDLRGSLAAEETDLSDRSATLASEQRTVLTRAVTSATIAIQPSRQSDVYVLRREGRSFFCPMDMPLRSWLSMTSLIDNLGRAAVGIIVPPESFALADEQFLRWRRDNPQAVPHIRQVTWGVPRTWFVLVVEEERGCYDDGAGASVRYRARIRDARRRVSSAHRTLRTVVDDSDLLEELAGLESWLMSFHDDSWVEVDYAGVAQLLGERLAGDHSARDIHQALDAISRGDLAAAGSAYRSFEDRWRVVNGFERAN
ncbi:MAG: hypothetical protein H0V07_10980 [Propionibacteriales bacterium]|nr:hypothetical protein [Propionibacteriales bacterium]